MSGDLELAKYYKVQTKDSILHRYYEKSETRVLMDKILT